MQNNVKTGVQNGKMKKLDPVGSTAALRDDEAVYWVSMGHHEELAVGT